MLGKMARGTFLIILVAMIVAWAVSVSKSNPAAPQDDQVVGRMYS